MEVFLTGVLAGMACFAAGGLANLRKYFGMTGIVVFAGNPNGILRNDDATSIFIPATPMMSSAESAAASGIHTRVERLLMGQRQYAPMELLLAMDLLGHEDYRSVLKKVADIGYSHRKGAGCSATQHVVSGLGERPAQSGNLASCSMVRMNFMRAHQVQDRGHGHVGQDTDMTRREDSGYGHVC